MSDSEYYNEDCNEIPVALEVQKPKKRAYSKRSDSEETYDALEVQKPKKRVYSKRSDSEETLVTHEVQKPKKRANSKRTNPEETFTVKEQPINKRKLQSFKKSLDKEVDAVDAGSKSETAFNLFGLVSKEEEHAAAGQNQNDQLPAVLISRVANGVIIRRKKRDGEFYVDIKVYKTSDALSTSREERWKKALTSLKLQTNPDSTEWKQLQAFFNTTRELMKDTKSIFFADKAF
ncbi:uncharacterized protein [Choristoneura fumiferana]|uniref:uncharacterized protein n=1 Tax=Choristoneura fumiferana TaxID=7141 RepID=UPI003D15B8C4